VVCVGGRGEDRREKVATARTRTSASFCKPASLIPCGFNLPFSPLLCLCFCLALLLPSLTLSSVCSPLSLFLPFAGV